MGGVSFSAAPGDIVGLIGPNGGGKSTLLKGIAGVLPTRHGQITLSGRDIRESSAHIAFVPQREEVNWEFPVSAREVVLMGRYRTAGWLRRPSRADRTAAEAALTRLGLDGIGNRHISQYSGGQQQRIFLARALVQDPVLVLLDEPFTGIDVANRAVFHEAIREFAASGAVVLIATHDLDEVRTTCSHVCLVNQRLVAYGPTATTYTPETLRATFGGQVAVFT
ncbi:MAG TPA: metal ABC transporter ATP-binding protein [Tepidiformaceae bacterium]|nr:metal ABC transporter ATP-binding protein [Tepidiformaceae bacterium]